jgi:SAM-dependent methyltransferase
MSNDELTATKMSWNVATRNHNAHKEDQAAFLRDGGDTLFSEELALLGDLHGRRIVHLQCNAGQDTLCLARRGAHAVGIDLSDEAITFARRLSSESGLMARFEESEVIAWLHATAERFDLAFASYGATGWLRDLDAYFRGVHRVLVRGGRYVYVEFHPLVWSIGKTLHIDGDDYFAPGPFIEPVRDYVALSGTALGARPGDEELPNDMPATCWQHSLGDIVDAVARAGLIVEHLREYPYANGCRVHEALVRTDGNRWVWPEPATGKLPLMFSISARRGG